MRFWPLVFAAIVAVLLILDACKVWGETGDYVRVYRSGPKTVNPLNHDGMLRLSRQLEQGPRVTYYRPMYRKAHHPRRGTRTVHDITNRATWRRNAVLAARVRAAAAVPVRQVAVAEVER